MGRLDDLEKRLDERLAALDRRLDRRLAGLEVKGMADATPVARGEGRPALAARTAGIPVENVFVDYATPGGAELVQLFEFVRNSPHVRENGLYAQILDATQFAYDPADDEMNAFATMLDGGGGTGKQPLVLFKGGAARFGRTAALAVVAMRGGDREAGRRFLALVKLHGLGKVDLEWVVRTVDGAELGALLKDDRALALAKSVSAGLFLGILAHEAGHLALGHLHRERGGDANNDISRNQEREADSFASSIIAASPFGEYILSGMLLFLYALAVLEEGGQATTHPLSKERFDNFVRANPDLAAEFGLTPVE